MELKICAASGVEVSGVPKEIRILPLGTVHSRKGDFLVDDESVELILNHFRERKIDLVIDYEHQTLADVQAPAGGWIKELSKGEDAVVAKVEWTPRAEDYLKNKEYRYLSPVVLVRKSDTKAVGIHSLALTNTPAIDGMFAIMNALEAKDYEEKEGGDTMELSEIIKLLKLPEGTDEAAVRRALGAAAKAAQGGTKEGENGTGKASADSPKIETVANSTILSMLGMDETAKTEDVAAAIMQLKAGGDGVNRELLALKEKIARQEANQAVEKALKEGKISAAQKEWATSYALKDAEGFAAFCDKAPAVVPQGMTESVDAPETDYSDETTAAILKASGISKEEAEKYYDKTQW